nr:ribosome-associated heat shock protein Hsp15 [Anaerobiospirillum sp. NML120448]
MKPIIATKVTIEDKQKIKDNLNSVRIDKWLWAARFYKTRSLARQMIEGGKVEYNGAKAKPSRNVEVGAKIKLLQGFSRKEVIVKAISDVRGPASVAITLYEETAESIERRQEEARLNKLAALINPHPDTKPNKKERRELGNLKQLMGKE